MPVLFLTVPVATAAPDESIEQLIGRFQTSYCGGCDLS